jgi:hypothetical protein
VIGGAFLDVWVDGTSKKPEGMTIYSQNWVGAWWTGFLVFGILCIIFAIPLAMYPALLPGTTKMKQAEARQKQAIMLAKRTSNNQPSLSPSSDVRAIDQDTPPLAELKR